MKRRKLSLPFKVNLLMTVMILAISAVLLFISNTYYWETVYDPHIRKLSQFSISNNEMIMPAARGVLRFMGTEKMREMLREEKDGKVENIWKRMSEIPSLAETGEADRTLLTDVMDTAMSFVEEWERLELDGVCVEARKNQTTYQVLQNEISNDGTGPFILSFGTEEEFYPGLKPEDARSPVLYRDGDGARLVCAVQIPAEEGELIIWAMYDMDDFFHHHWRFLNQSILLILIMAVLASVAGGYLLRRLVTRRVLKLAKATGDFVPGEDGQFSRENLCQAEEDPADEIDWLGKDIRTMQERMIENSESLARMTAEKERISTELNLARQIQAAALPADFPTRPEFDLYASMTPAREVGGDFYDFFLVDEDHLAMVIADVSGKGIPAALFMMVAKSLIKNQLMAGCDPAQAVQRANQQLCEGNDARMFVTVWAAVLQLSTGQGSVCNAGHEKPALRRADGKFDLLDYRHDPMAGALKKAKYHVRDFELYPGDCLFVYTDGVTEANDAEEGMFGEKGLARTLNGQGNANPEEIVRGVQKALDHFTNGTPQFDDITMMCLRYHGPAEGAQKEG